MDHIGPKRALWKTCHWQAKEQQGFDTSHFHIDWDAEKATCPAGCASLSWTPAIDQYDNEVIKIKFSSDPIVSHAHSKSTVPKPHAVRSRCVSRNTIKPYKKPGHVKRGRSSGRNTAADQ